MKKALKYFLILILTAVFAVWVYCWPVTFVMSYFHFNNYIREYNIPKDDIAFRRSSKTYMLQEVYISVEYKSDPDYVYNYAYDVGQFSDIRPRYVSISYKSPYTYVGGNSLNENEYYNVKYPPVSQIMDYRTPQK